jgi:putative membrane protein
MAWVRTATSLISFGFTIYKFFQFDLGKQPPRENAVLGPREFALVMISIGLVSLALSAWDHRRHMKALRNEFGNVPYSTATVVATLVAGMGLVALVAVILRA